MDRVIGTLSSLSVYNDKWGRGRIRQDDGKLVQCVGAALVGLKKGNRYRVTGRVAEHARYGRQIAVAAAEIDLPCTEEVLVQHLRRNFKGCGEVTARKFVECHRDDLAGLRETLIRNPYSLDFSAVTKRSVRAADNIDLAGLIYRDLASRLAELGARDTVLRRLAAWLAGAPATEDPIGAAWARLCADPFAPLSQVEAYDFPLADAIAAGWSGIGADDPRRLAALAMYALHTECERHGHAYLTRAEWEAAILACDGDALPQRVIEVAQGCCAGFIEDEQRFYPRPLFHHESALANGLGRRALLLAQPIFEGDTASLEQAIDAAEHSFALAYGRDGTGFKLDHSQRAAVAAILSSSHLLHTLTASPGAGKTALMEILAHVARQRKIVFCAPTGKAAKVLGERVKRFGFYASTIHALLGVTDDGFGHHAEQPLDADIVVADEASMNDLALARALVDALPDDCHLIFLGDTGQLPSIGPGQVLRNLLELPGNHRQLNETHRNCAGILEVVRQCNLGRLECADLPQVRFSHRLPAPSLAALERLAQRYQEAVQACGMANVGLLMPRRRGDPHMPGWNTTFLNEFLRQRMNADGERIVGTGLCLGDRIIVRKNLTLDQDVLPNGNVHLEQVVNGDTGFIDACRMDAAGTSVTELTIRLDDGRIIRFPGKALESLDLAYAMTVHAAQGSEYQRVIFICTPGSPTFLHRGLLYTAFSRAREDLLVLADDAVLRAVCERAVPQRNSALVERTRQAMRRLQHCGGR